MFDGNHRLRAQIGPQERMWFLPTARTVWEVWEQECARVDSQRDGLVYTKPVQTAYFKPIQVWKDNNKIMRHMEKLSWRKKERAGVVFISREELVSFLSWMILLFWWWEHCDRHCAFAVREVPADYCCTGPTGAAIQELRPSHIPPQSPCLPLPRKQGSHPSPCCHHPQLHVYPPALCVREDTTVWPGSVTFIIYLVRLRIILIPFPEAVFLSYLSAKPPARGSPDKPASLTPTLTPTNRCRNVIQPLLNLFLAGPASHT